MTNLRIGHGYDVHRLTERRRLVLGGVEIPWDRGLLGHSDADVLTHAVEAYVSTNANPLTDAAALMAAPPSWGTSASCSRTAIPATPVFPAWSCCGRWQRCCRREDGPW